MRGIRRSTYVRCFLTMAFLVARGCGPYSHWTKETVRIDLDSAVVTYTFTDVRPMYADSVEKGWKELMSIIDERPKVDTADGGLVTASSSHLEVIDDKRLNVVLRYEILPGQGYVSYNGLTWHSMRNLFGQLLVEHGEVVLLAKPAFFDHPGDTSCRLETTHTCLTTQKNHLLVFPDSTRRVEYSFVYSFPESRATYREIYNRERNERGWAQEW